MWHLVPPAVGYTIDLALICVIFFYFFFFFSFLSSGVCLSTTNFLVLGKLFHNPLSNECIMDLVSRYELGLTDWWRREYGGLDFAYGTQEKTQASNDSVLL